MFMGLPWFVLKVLLLCVAIWEQHLEDHLGKVVLLHMILVWPHIQDAILFNNCVWCSVFPYLLFVPTLYSHISRLQYVTYKHIDKWRCFLNLIWFVPSICFCPICVCLTFVHEPQTMFYLLHIQHNDNKNTKNNTSCLYRKWYLGT